MPPPKELNELIDRFERNIASYQSSGYKETEVRREFIDPFFRLLGWDIDNTAGNAEAYKDVVHEDSVRIGQYVRAPDYSFRIGGTRKFFVEAKKPSSDIQADSAPAFQLRRYAWSAKLPLGLLTDFEELAIYDCTTRPSKSDKATSARVSLYSYKDYLSKWDEISSRFSRDAVLKGDFDRFAADARKKRGTTEVDDEFLAEIEKWRSRLAVNIALRNNISEKELNFSVQRIIDRIIFLRIAEDRGLEHYGQLKDMSAKVGVYGRLREVFQRADGVYNSGLFHFHAEKGRDEAPDKITSLLKIDDKPLGEILASTYYPDSPYEFSVLPTEILGHIYERFLGKTIRLTDGHRASIEIKPEVRKSGGVYYTPQHIVRHIVEKTVGKAIEGKTPGKVESLRIIDPACGSGSFLLGAYQFLLDWHLAYYVENGTKKPRKEIFQGPRGDWRLTSAEKKRILINNIYGVDIDSQAVEVTKLSLLLKVLEGESDETLKRQLSLFQERALPDLGCNIKCGNSLVGMDCGLGEQGALFRDVDTTSVNPFDWRAEFPECFPAQDPNAGFDIVLGNPPYDVLEKDRGKSSWPHDVLAVYAKGAAEYAPALGGKLNLYRFFLIKSLNLLRNGGWFGMIVPMSILADISCSNTRRFITQTCCDLEADCFPQKDNANRRVFRDAKLSTVVITARRRDSQAPDYQILVRTHPWDGFKDEHKTATIDFRQLSILDPETMPIPLLSDEDWALCKRIYSRARTKRLGDLKDFHIARGEVNQTNFKNFITDNPRHARLLKGVEVGMFHLKPELRQGEREFFDEDSFLRKETTWDVVNAKRIATQRITGVDDATRITACLIQPKTYFADSTNSISLKDGARFPLEFILGLLNSKLFQWRFKLTSTNNNVGTNELAGLPFPEMDLEIKSEREAMENLAQTSAALAELNESAIKAKLPNDQEAIARRIQAQISHLNQVVYSLFEVQPSEIAIIERGATKFDQ